MGHTPGVNRLLLLLLVLAPAQAAAPLVEHYQVNAQYADPSVKKNISKIGEGTVTYVTGPASAFGVKLAGRVQSPRDGTVYEFAVDIDYHASGTNISQVANRSTYSASAQEYRSRIESVVPFVYLVKFNRPGEHQSERSFRFRGSDYTLRTTQTEQQIEVALYEDQAFLAKFFLKKDATGNEQVYDKIRLPTEGKISLTFVRL